MSKGLSTTLIGVAVVLVVVGLLNHFALHMNAVPHTSSIIGVLAVILAAVGVYGLMSSSKTA
jgi:hypothetical protein